jgi:hypothetical protein
MSEAGLGWRVFEVAAKGLNERRESSRRRDTIIASEFTASTATAPTPER